MNLIKANEYKSTIVSCVESGLSFLKQHNIKINFEGKLFKILPIIESQIFILRLVCITIIICIFYIIKHISYYPVTVIGNTVYSRVITSCLNKQGIRHMSCGNPYRLVSYQTTDGDKIAFEGPNYNYFDNSKLKDKVALLQNSQGQIEELEAHTGLSNLKYAQEQVLLGFEDRDGIYFGSIEEIITDHNKIDHPSINIKYFFGDLYYITNSKSSWITRVIISDNVIPLQPYELISCLYNETISCENNHCSIEQDIDYCIIHEQNIKTTLNRRINYKVCDNLAIKRLNLSSDNESILYSLKYPRSFKNNYTYMIHPFHFPQTWDIFLTIMLLTYALTYELT